MGGAVSGGGGSDGDRDVGKAGATDPRGKLALGDLQVDDKSVADIAATARQATGKIAVSFEIGAPRLAPEVLGDLAALDDHGRDRAIPLLELGQFSRGSLPLLGDRDVISPFEPGITHP